MKKSHIAIALALLVTTTTFTSCQKYEDGPGVSLRSRRERISNTWKVENYKINGTDFTSLVSDYTETFTKDYDYSYTWGILSGTGAWVFQNNDEEVHLSGSDDQASRTLFLEKLEEKTLWYYFMEGEDKHELHLVSQ